MVAARLGEEVVVDDPKLRRQLANLQPPENRTHVVDLHETRRQVNFDVDTEVEYEDCTDNEAPTETEDECSQFLIGMTEAKPVTPARMRAE